MKLIKPTEIFEMSTRGQSTCLTIYVNHPQEINDCLAEARRVAAKDLNETEMSELLAPVRYLIAHQKWNSSPLPTGIFVREGFAGFMKIPFATKNLAVVASSFHVKPLLKWLQRDKPFFLLHLDQDKATLFQGSLSGLRPLDKFNYKKSRSLDYALDLVDRSVLRTIQKTQQPLLLSGDDALTDSYRNLCQYNMLVEQTISEMSPDPKIKELHHSCLMVLEPFLENVEDSLVKKFWSAKARGGVSSNLNDIISRALLGQVRHLFINETMNIWGRIDYRTGTFTHSTRQMDSQDDDILDDLAELVLFHRGSVTVLPGRKMPESQAASAILRPLFEPHAKNEIPIRDSDQVLAKASDSVAAGRSLAS